MNTPHARLYLAVGDNAERMWWLGTDILEDHDRRVMATTVEHLNDRGRTIALPPGATYQHRDDCGAIFNVDYMLEESPNEPGLPRAREDGYSHGFMALLQEAKRRGYAWILFDRDIRTKERS